MTSIPFYWYVEVEGPSDLAEFLPRCTFGPAPTFSGRVWCHDANGEVHGEAILMRGLPWPRFRRFVDGKEVHLPYWSSIALERVEMAWQASGLEAKCACGLDHGSDRRTHIRVEIIDPERYALSVWDNSHFENAFPSKAKRDKSLAATSGKPVTKAYHYAVVKPPLGGVPNEV